MGNSLSRLVVIWIIVQTILIYLLSAHTHQLADALNLSVVGVISGIVYIQFIVAVLCIIFTIMLQLRLVEKILWGIILAAAALFGWPISPLLFLLFYFFVLRKNYPLISF
jgi:hypothetical protein